MLFPGGQNLKLQIFHHLSWQLINVNISTKVNTKTAALLSLHDLHDYFGQGACKLCNSTGYRHPPKDHVDVHLLQYILNPSRPLFLPPPFCATIFYHLDTWSLPLLFLLSYSPVHSSEDKLCKMQILSCHCPLPLPNIVFNSFPLKWQEAENTLTWPLYIPFMIWPP